MGFFKTVKDVRAMGQHHGGMPSVRGAFSDLGKLSDDRGERDIIATGEPASALVKGMPRPLENDRFAMSILLEVRPVGGTPYDLDYVFPSTRMKAGLMLGMEIPVKVDPADPARVAVQWDALSGSIAAQGGAMQAAMNGFGTTYLSTADDAFRAATGQQPPAGPGAPTQG